MKNVKYSAIIDIYTKMIYNIFIKFMKSFYFLSISKELLKQMAFLYILIIIFKKEMEKWKILITPQKKTEL